MADLTLPGSIPGLLRRGSPVPYPRAADISCVVVAVGERTAVVGYPYPVDHETSDVWPLADLALDLTDATGRAHAAWWLANYRWRWGLDLLTVSWEHDPKERRPHRWVLCSGRGAFEIQPSWAQKHEGNVPSLADLDPADPRLLPDGSRWVDAEALRRVVLHVAGVPHV